ncbi:MAG: hypothetical protein U0176_20050 [Bacteroidia bacterium]
MNNSKLMRWTGTFVFGSFAVFNIITLLTFSSIHYPFGPEVAGPYSIFSSEKFFIVYHIWGIALSILCIYTMWKDIRLLFMISLFLLMLVMFYPYFTGSPTEKAKGQKQVEMQDSVNHLGSDSILPPK